jgi:RNA polymerase sigma-70 factor (ECF subfamily)
VATASATQIDPSREHDQRDQQLYDAWSTGDRVAGNTLVDLYFARLRLYFVTRAAGEHEDLVQTTFLRLSESHDKYRGGSFRAFLFGIARNVFFEHLHERYRLAAIDPLTDSFAQLTRSGFTARLAEREEHRLLLDALMSLPLEVQELLELYYWQQFKGREIAVILDIPAPTVRGRLITARRRLCESFCQLRGKPHAIEFDEEEVKAWLVELRAVLKRVKSSI